MSELAFNTHGRRERAKAANREAILDAARLVFAELGFEATTVRDIIRGTNLASGTFYNYFKSKEDVMEALARESVTRFRPMLQEVRENSNSFESYLRGAFRTYFHFLARSEDDQPKLHPTQVEFTGVRVDTPEMQVVFDEIRKDIENALERQGQVGIDTEYLTASAIGIARELGDCMIRRMVSGQGESIEKTTEYATNMVLIGVRHLFENGDTAYPDNKN